MPVQVLTAGGVKNSSQQKSKLSPSRPRTKENQNRYDDEKNTGINGNEGKEFATVEPLLTFENGTEQAAELSVPKKQSPKNIPTNTAATEPLDALFNSSTAASSPDESSLAQNIWLFICFFGILLSFVCYGLLLEYATSGGRQLHELSFLFVTSGLYTLTAAAGRHVRDEKPSSMPPARFAILGLTSMGSTFCSVRSLRYVIYPVQVLAKSCKPVPVMLMGALMGKKYPLRKYFNVFLIVSGVALFMGG
jgi:UAA transporter family